MSTCLEFGGVAWMLAGGRRDHEEGFHSSRGDKKYCKHENSEGCQRMKLSWKRRGSIGRVMK